jgi:hypothetical protein
MATLPSGSMCLPLEFQHRRQSARQQASRTDDEAWVFFLGVTRRTAFAVVPLARSFLRPCRWLHRAPAPEVAVPCTDMTPALLFAVGRVLNVAAVPGGAAVGVPSGFLDQRRDARRLTATISVLGPRGVLGAPLRFSGLVHLMDRRRARHFHRNNDGNSA